MYIQLLNNFSVISLSLIFILMSTLILRDMYYKIKFISSVTYSNLYKLSLKITDNIWGKSDETQD